MVDNNRELGDWLADIPSLIPLAPGARNKIVSNYSRRKVKGGKSPSQLRHFFRLACPVHTNASKTPERGRRIGALKIASEKVLN